MLYELAGVVKQRPCAQRFSGTTEIWKGTHDGKVVALKVLRLSRGGEMVKRNDSRTSEDDTGIKVARQVSALYNPSRLALLTDGCSGFVRQQCS